MLQLGVQEVEAAFEPVLEPVLRGGHIRVDRPESEEGGAARLRVGGKLVVGAFGRC